MNKLLHVYVLLLMFVFCTSCRGQNKTEVKKNIVKSETKGIVTSPGSNEKYHTRYEYTDSLGKGLIIQNSFPRGGAKYTDPNGNDYNYAVFWTQITNKTDSALELHMDFPVDSYQVPSLPGTYYKVLIPADTMTLEKVPLFNYGLTNLESFLDNSIHKSVLLRRTINSKESNGFYVVILCLTEGAHGTMRTELTLKGQNLFYRIKLDGSKSNTKSSDQQIHCGSINLKNLKLISQRTTGI